MDIQTMVSEARKISAIWFAKWLNETYSGNIFGLDFEKLYSDFELWYQKEVVNKNATNGSDRPY